ncbi:MAG: CDP-archaeol synthase [Promethearchaeati archaeon]
MPDESLIESDKREKKIAKILAVCFALLFLADFMIVSFIFSWADWVATLIFSLLLIAPGYISNAGMVLVGGGKPIDGGKICKDGRRILGDHKTVNGLIKGPLYVGIPISLGIYLLFIILWPFINPIVEAAASIGQYQLYSEVSYYQYYFTGGSLPIGVLVLIIRIILCSYGAAVGDLIGSFLKRRFGIESGRPFWVIDQLDFAIFSMLFVSIPALISPNLFLIPDLNIFIFLMILTPSVSIIANTIAYVIGVKDVPW